MRKGVHMAICECGVTRSGVFGVAVGCVFAALGGVFDDATAWWKFDRGGADGAVATKAEIHDARDSALNQPTGLFGS